MIVMIGRGGRSFVSGAVAHLFSMGACNSSATGFCMNIRAGAYERGQKRDGYEE